MSSFSLPLLGSRLSSVAAALVLVTLGATAAAAAQTAPELSEPRGRDQTAAEASVADAEALWQLLDYIAVDYAGAVADGKVTNPAEYAEMQEFAQLVRRQTQRLEAASPVGAGAGALAPMAEALARAVAEKAPASTVATLARQLAAALAERFNLTLAPTRAPDLSRAAALYQENCASCHGAEGAGDGPLAAGMDPPPIAFTDRERAAERSLASYFATISRGVDGTAMPAFAHLDPEARWALAFHIGSFAYPAGLAAQGRRLWREDAALRAVIPNLEALAALTPAELAQRIGEERATALLAFLRRHPGAVTAASETTLALARARLDEALTLYRQGDKRAAARAALSAYLDGVEPVEPLLRARAPERVPAIEQAMAAVRRAIQNNDEPSALEAAVAAARAELDAAERLLGSASTANRLTTATAAFTILLREGLEALLLVVAMATFLAKAGRREMLPWVHGGWIAALMAGFATWLLATRLITISGATRELTEGLGGLLAAIVLVSVGVWMHGRATAAGWQRYIAETMQRALTRRSAWFLAALAFLVVYREAFETILFYVALWSEGQRAAVAGGAAAGAGVLFVIALAAVRFARRLPIRAFFVVSSWLIAVLAIVLAGKGVAALQEAGWIGATPLPGLPRIDWVGLFPTRETLYAQLAVVFATFGAFAWQSWRETRTERDAAAG